MPVVALGTAPAIDGTQPPTEEAAWELKDLRSLDDIGGIVRSISPDGQWLAGVGPDRSFCVWDVASLVSDCHVLGQPIADSPLTTMAWAPDSSAVAFYLDVAVRFVDSDVYLYEIADRTVVNLTDDGFEGSLLDAEDVPGDLVPTWSPDSSELAFARSTVTEEGGTTLMRVSRDGGEATEVVTVPGGEQLAVWTAMYWLADDTIVFSVLGPDPENPANGIWRVGADGSGLEQILAGTPEADIPQPMVADVTADGATASVMSINRLTGGSFLRQAVFWTVDLATSAVAPLPGSPAPGDEPAASTPIVLPKGPLPTAPAAFSPDGELALVAYRPLDDAPVSFKVLDVATGVTAPVTAPPQIELAPTQLTWLDDGVVLVAAYRFETSLATLEPAGG